MQMTTYFDIKKRIHFDQESLYIDAQHLAKYPQNSRILNHNKSFSEFASYGKAIVNIFEKN